MLDSFCGVNLPVRALSPSVVADDTPKNVRLLVCTCVDDDDGGFRLFVIVWVGGIRGRLIAGMVLNGHVVT